MDAITLASKTVSDLLKMKLDTPPILIKTVHKEDDSNNVEEEEALYKLEKTVSTIAVYEVWKIYLEQEVHHSDTLYIVISGDCVLQGYGKGEWSDVRYLGFYSTLEESINEINGYL